MRKKKLRHTCELLQLIKKLKNVNDVLFLYNNLEKPTKALFFELIFNLLYNKNALCLSSSQTSRLRKIISPHKNEMEYIAKKSGSDVKKKKIMKKQIGNGLIGGIISVLAPVLASIVARQLK